MLNHIESLKWPTQIDLRVFVLTFNMARLKLDIDYNTLFPKSKIGNLVVWGAQECPIQDKA